ncbi:VWFA-related protein [Edaphobacter aggregans]|uniref:VWFA-related protein n=1 Tax=Edaphobacter aggregans TaxID=570835 RepID=A0A3R9QKS7_9BACT|nr:VWA domain-containing protein [Edaphobacter aggregans]RSL18918.1 VWFA-related protein [Edaphobacter aggregans]
MSKPFHVCAVLLFFLPALGFAQRDPPVAEGAAQPAAVSSLPRDTAEGLIKLDVVVTDKSGKSVPGLKSSDFTLLDNGEPEKVLSFQAFDGITAKPDPPVEVIFVIDTLFLPPHLIPIAKNEVEKFLRRNNGHLAQPVSIFLLSETGLSSTPQPSTNGTALADAIARGIWQTPAFHGTQTPKETAQLFQEPRSGLSLMSLGSIVLEERRKPGRKLLFWLSPGWWTVAWDNPFHDITEFSTRLREARIALWSWPYPDGDLTYKNFLAPVKSARKVRNENFLLNVLATQSGGGVLETRSDLAEMISKCVEEASVFYSFTFDPPHTNEVDDYRDLKVVLRKPQLTARTSTGYYNEPVYYDQPSGADRISMDQLEQMLGAARDRGDKEVARELYGVELTERMSSTRLSSWKTRLPGKESRAALVALADRSVFLPLPAADIASTAPPDMATQRLILARAVDYVSKTVVKLPDFFATRTTVQYNEPPLPEDATWKTAMSDQSLHVTETSNTTVLVRNSKEVVDSDTRKRKQRKARLDTEGTFGPILAMVFVDAAAAHSEFTWSHWEQGTDGLEAVFRYTIPYDKSQFEVGFCCLADPDGTIFFKKYPAYQVEIAIDPASGAIVRVAVNADLGPKLPMLSSGVMVEYGPVEIGGKTYICPTRSVSIQRTRTVKLVKEWGESFGVYARFETILNDFSFGQYHIFRAQSRILPDDTPVPKEK